MASLNCWEFKHCGRQPGGAKVGALGVCPAATNTRVNRVNGGHNGGRACWAVAGTLCGGRVQGTFAAKLPSCVQCEFYRLVEIEEGHRFESATDILVLLGQVTPLV